MCYCFEADQNGPREDRPLAFNLQRQACATSPLLNLDDALALSNLLNFSHKSPLLHTSVQAVNTILHMNRHVIAIQKGEYAVYTVTRLWTPKPNPSAKLRGTAVVPCAVTPSGAILALTTGTGTSSAASKQLKHTWRRSQGRIFPSFQISPVSLATSPDNGFLISASDKLNLQ